MSDFTHWDYRRVRMNDGELIYVEAYWQDDTLLAYAQIEPCENEHYLANDRPLLRELDLPGRDI